MKESSALEFKESASSKTYLKTVSAFANYRSGKILFGVRDDGEITGIQNAEQTALNIENQINDNIIPQPEYSVLIDEETGVITLKVEKGEAVPYRYHGKAYKRNGTSTIEADTQELNRLILEGKNLEYGDLIASEQNLDFHYFQKYWENNYSIPADRDLMISLGIYDQNRGFTNTGELLSDQNRFPGISIVRYGDNLNIILERYSIENDSILAQYDRAMDILTRMLTYEEIDKQYRKIRYRIPAEAIRESLINAVAHRDWADQGQIQIEVFDDKVVVLSPGGLPQSMSRDEYLYSIRSIPRNTNLTFVLLRLNLIERLGTGIRKIRNVYEGTGQEPEFLIFENSIQITLPVTDRSIDLTEEQDYVYQLLRSNRALKRSEIMDKTGYSQATTIRILNQLIEMKKIRRKGKGPGVVYVV